jgi:hypothetical protein
MKWTDNQNYKGPNKDKVVAKHIIKTTGGSKATFELIEISLDKEGL